MKIIIYGVGKNCEKLIAKMKEYPEFQIVGLSDSYKIENQWGFPMIELADHVNEYKDIPIVITVIHPLSVMKIYEKLHGFGYQNIYKFLDKAYCWKKDFLTGECVKLENITEHWLPRLEMHAANHCNLNCKCCSNFSPLFEKEFPNYEQGIRDIIKLGELAGGVLEFNLFGGEPLLNPHIADYVVDIRKNLFVLDLRVVTNGLLITGLPEEILQCFHDNDVVVSISEYEPTHRIIEKIRKRLESYQVDYFLNAYEQKKIFYKLLSSSKDSKYPHGCLADICVNISNGKIARCPMLLYLHKLNDRFELELPEEGVFEIDEFENGRAMKQKLMQKYPLCDHCIKKEVSWSQCGKVVVVEDFIEAE